MIDEYRPSKNPSTNFSSRSTLEQNATHQTPRLKIILSRAGHLSRPAGGTTRPYSPRCPRSALIVWVRCRISGSRTRKTLAAPCVSSLFTGTKRMVGLCAASQIASASAASFFCRLNTRSSSKPPDPFRITVAQLPSGQGYRVWNSGRPGGQHMQNETRSLVMQIRLKERFFLSA